MTTTLEERLLDYVDRNRDALTGLIADLVRCPSENTPPSGNEGRCQRYLFDALQRIGYTPELYALDSVPGLHAHPLYAAGRNYSGRPNLVAHRAGTGRGRSLILSGHIDTVPRGTQNWSRDPFSGHVDGNRLYGRGSNDMKAGVAINLFVASALAELKLRLRGDFTFETVVDEEFGGVNGTLAARVRGITADAAIVSEPSFLRICAAQRGGRTVHITFRAPGGVLSDGAFPAGVIDQVTHFLSALREFATLRRTADTHPLYAGCPDPVPVSVTKIFTAPWGTTEPITVPEECKVELFWQLMPGEEQAPVEKQFMEWFDTVLASAPQLFAYHPTVEYPIRWLPGSAIDPALPLVQELQSCAATVLPAPPPIVGIEGPCDMFVFHDFGIPAVLWGPSGGNTHAADEYVDLDSAVAAAKALLLFVSRWCGVDEGVV
jgi:acetylornithine deacetylase